MNFIFFPGKNNNDETFHQEEALQPEPVGEKMKCINSSSFCPGEGGGGRPFLSMT